MIISNNTFGIAVKHITIVIIYAEMSLSENNTFI